MEPETRSGCTFKRTVCFFALFILPVALVILVAVVYRKDLEGAVPALQQLVGFGDPTRGRGLAEGNPCTSAIEVMPCIPETVFFTHYYDARLKQCLNKVDYDVGCLHVPPSYANMSVLGMRECQEKCIRKVPDDICYLPFEFGTCTKTDLIPLYYMNTTTNTCQQWRPENGTCMELHYDSEAVCEHLCGAGNGGSKCMTKRKLTMCHFLKKAIRRKVFYNRLSNECQGWPTFCLAGPNKFQDEESCRRTCIA
ncbi:uncharacterized protein LOC135390073 [Ornithodoros turicata]|uniref:uncharacterized protein LOC135390073 n=1 Tax=Ornithodoros turicata TaxID=34597 RepID=UPI0031391876